MTTHRVSKPSRAKQSVAEESGRPGTCRSNVGCAAIDEPCTNRIVPMLLAGSPAHFSNKNSFTPPSFVVQWSSLLTAAVGLLISFIVSPVLMISIDRFNAVGFDDLGPFRDLSVHEALEFGLGHH